MTKIDWLSVPPITMIWRSVPVLFLTVLLYLVAYSTEETYHVIGGTELGDQTPNIVLLLCFLVTAGIWAWVLRFISSLAPIIAILGLSMIFSFLFGTAAGLDGAFWIGMPRVSPDYEYLVQSASDNGAATVSFAVLLASVLALALHPGVRKWVPIVLGGLLLLILLNCFAVLLLHQIASVFH